MFNIDRRLIQNFDWVTFAAVVVISIIGAMTIFSATRLPEKLIQSPLFIKQLLWIAVGICGLFIFMGFDYIWFSRLSVLFYIIGIILLIIVLVTGRVGMGAQRWISLGPLSFQPSEFFKIAFVIMLANILSLMRSPLGMSALLRIFVLVVLLPFVLLVKQPDLGTAVVLMLIFVAVLFSKGLQTRVAAILITIGLISLPFIGEIMWTGLKGYQKNRLIAFLDPETDPSGIGYQINQSKVAIGSGQVLGKGFLKGTQGPFRFLPERHTDFIFAVFAEEWGFVGSAVLMLLYLILLLRGIDTARKAKDEFGKLLALGVTYMFAVYFFINIGMTLGMTPVVGIPLPFMSYGGTALLSNFLAAGILINVRTRRFTLFY